MSERRGSRRRFLAAACLLPAALRARWDSAHDLHLGLSARRWGREFALDELLDLLEATGMAGVELAAEGGQGVSIELGPEARELLRRRFDERAVTLVGLASDVRLGASDEGLERRAGERARAWLELAHDLGALGVRLSVAVARDEERAAWIARTVAALQPLAARASELALELRIDAPDAPERWSALLAALDPPCAVAAPVIAARVPAELAARLGRSVRIADLPAGDSALAETVAALARAGSVRWCLLDPEVDAPPDLAAALAERRARFAQLVAGEDEVR